MVPELELMLALLTAVAVLAAIANRFNVPYPIFLVIGGLLLGLVPGLPVVALEPDAVFLIFLPPILFSAAYFTSWRDFRANARPIGLLAFGLVLTTTAAVAAVSHALIAEMTWPVAFVLGAIVSPPDAIAATAIFQRLRAPRRIVTILEGESLVNDATALVALRFAIAAVVTGSFSFGEASLDFVLLIVGGVAIGLGIGWLLGRVIAYLDDPPIEIALTLLAPFAAYLSAETLGFSGVLATVTSGLYFGRRAATALGAASRLQGEAVWGFVIFVVNGLAFILIGLQLPDVLDSLADRPVPALLWHAAVIALVVIIVRFLWVFPATYLPRRLSAGMRARDPYPSWRGVAVVSWSGLRGAVSLAAALSLPTVTDTGDPFPARDLILFFAFVVILVTLVGQGLSLPWLMRRLGVADDRAAEQEILLARRSAAEAALARLDEVVGEPWADSFDVARFREAYEHDLEILPASLDLAEVDHDHVAAHGKLRHELQLAERDAIIALRNSDAIGDDALDHVLRDLDLAAERNAL